MIEAITNDPVMLNDWHPVAFSTALTTDLPLGLCLLGEDIVIWRSSAATAVHAWQDRCVHRGAKLSLGECRPDHTLQCPYHGWAYDSSGRCIHIPALPEHTPPQRAQIKRYRVKERYGLIWVCLGTPAQDIPVFPEWAQNDFRKIPCGPYPVATSGPRIVENFLDVAHFAFVHRNILGSQKHAAIDDYQVNSGPNGVEATNVRVYQPDPYGTGQGDTVAYTYRALRPLTAYLLKQSTESQFSILLTITPHEPTTSTAWMWMAMNYGHELDEQALIDWQNEIFAQDEPIVISQRPQRLPLAPQAELSMRCDRTAVSYRRWLQTLGLEFGVIRDDN